MDVTPRELRDLDIRVGFHGYNKDEVDDLLERAAKVIENLEGQLRDTQQRAEADAVDASRTRESEEMLQRTLLLAQRAADEAVAEAQAKARQILDDAETKSTAMISEAETTARRQAETERRRLEGEVLELGAKRDALSADIEALEQFESDYRARLRRAVEADLEQLSNKGSVAPSPRPTTHDVVMPKGASGAPASTPEPPSPPGASAPGLAADRPAPAPAPVTPGPPPVAPAAPVAAPSASTPAPAPERSSPSPEPARPAPPRAPESAEPTIPPFVAGPAGERTDVPWEEAAAPSTARPPLFDAEPDSGGDQLDDDAFFASLREAVTDETPLGPRDDAGLDSEDQRGGLFRRRGR